MKCHHPDVFCCALLNSQPMGFYAPTQVVPEARGHRVEIRPVCVNASRWDWTLEARRDGRPGMAVRLGLRMVKGLADDVLPLFAAADAGQGDRPAPELVEPLVLLRPMREGQEVVEDYGAVGLTLRRPRPRG